MTRLLLIMGVLLFLVGGATAGQGYLMDVSVPSSRTPACFAGVPCDPTPERLVNQHLVWRSNSLQGLGEALLIAGAVLFAAGAVSPRRPQS